MITSSFKEVRFLCVMKGNDNEVLKKKVKYFFDGNIKVHIKKKNKFFHNGLILEFQGDMLIIEDQVNGSMPIYLEEIFEIEKDRGKPNEQKNNT